MKLSKLTLHGYKTFASKTVFEFTEGITAIVGPNGSGKSNIADAIRWVLGEQSYSTLRGKRTEDMIFAGSRERPRAGMAQAILTLDNSSGWLPIQYSEIEIGRRAYRSGENEYLLNGQKVRLRDVVELLAAGELAHHSYTIISQGLVDQALSIRADERRELFEGAAGVSQYKLRRAETLRRLRETERNLERLHDILAEIRPRVNTLRRQANRAETYEQVAADLRHHLRIWYGYRWDKANQALQKARQKSQSARQMWETGRREQLSIQGEVDELRNQLASFQQSVSTQEDQRDSLREKAAEVRQHVAVLKERKKLIDSQLLELRSEIPVLLDKQKKAYSETNQAIMELDAAQQEVSLKQAELQKFDLASKSIQDKIADKQARFNALKKSRSQVADDIAQSSGRKSQLVNQIEGIRENLDNFSLNDSDLELVESLKAEEADLQLQLEQSSQLLEKKRRELDTLTHEKDSINEKKQDLDDERTGFREDVIGFKAQLIELTKSVNKYSEPVLDGKLLGKFSDFVTIPERFNLPITAALSYRLRTYAVSDSNSFWSVVSDPDGGSISIADLSKINVPSKQPLPDRKDVIGWASSLVNAEDEVEPLVSLLLGQVMIVSDKFTAYELAPELTRGTVAVSLDGFVAHAGGLFQVGAAQPYSIDQDRVLEIDELRAKLEDRKSLLETVSAKISKLNNDDEKQTAIIKNVREMISDLEQKESETKFQLFEATRSKELKQQQIKHQNQQLAANHKELTLLENKLEHLETSIAESQRKLSQIDEKLEQQTHELSELPVTEMGLKQDQHLQQIQSAKTIVAGRQAVVDSRRATLNQLDDQVLSRQKRLQLLESDQQELDIDARVRELQDIIAKLDEIDGSLQPLRSKLANGRKSLSAYDKRLATLQRKNHNAEDRFTQARIELAQAENQIESLRERIVSDLGLVVLSNPDDSASQSPLPLAEVVDELPIVESLPDDIQETISNFRGQLTRIGPVNLDAPGEYHQTKERYDYMSQQVEDLTATKARLEEVIEDLDDLTSTAFAKTVKQVDKEFGSVFKRLFGGGSAQLILTDPDDLTESGVDIVARLPRRREQGLALLSGGERSLTAAALIFSLLKVSPTPFCVLDEVDAMLDEANVNRFRELLEELSDETQFILITHNRGTVQVAETVYGVSMGADSVSQVISIKPEDYLKSTE